MYHFPILAIMYCSPNDIYTCHLVHYTCIWLLLYVLCVHLNTAAEVYIPCDSACKNGYCDYTCGTCVCHPFYTGEQCDQPLSKLQFTGQPPPIHHTDKTSYMHCPVSIQLFRAETTTASMRERVRWMEVARSSASALRGMVESTVSIPMKVST